MNHTELQNYGPISSNAIGSLAAAHMESWRSLLAGSPEPAEVLAHRRRAGTNGADVARAPVPLREHVYRSLHALADLEHTSVQYVALSGLAALLYRYTGCDDLLIAMPARGDTAGRLHILRLHLHDAQSFRALVRAVTVDARAAQQLEPLAPAELRELRGGGPAVVRSAHAGYVWAIGDGAQVLERPLPVADFTVMVQRRGTAPHLELLWDPGLYESTTIVRMADHLVNIFEAAVADFDRPIGHLNLLSREERHKITVDWNQTAFAFPRDRFLPQMISRAASARPQSIAVVHRDRRLSFAELNLRANQIAHHLRGRGVREGARVALCMERSAESVVAQMGILKAGGAVLFLDPSQPGPRLELLIRHAGTAAVFGPGDRLDMLEDGGATKIRVDRERAEIESASGEDPEIELTVDSPVLVAATSGSTGEPKIVLCRHGALNNMMSWLHRETAISVEARGTWSSSPGYGISQMEWWPFLGAGAAVHVADADVAGSPEAFHDWLISERITHTLVMTPLATRMWALGWPKQTALRFMQVAGERLQAWPPEHLPFEVLNAYGSAEATLVTVCKLFATARALATDDLETRRPPVGRPLFNVRAYVLDRHGAPVPPEVTGELYVAGDSLSLGYTDAALTRDKFVASPLPEEASAPVYRTGDLARYWDDGTIEVCGRADSQMKIRGSRVEPAEVERVLTAQAGITQAVVVDRENASGDKQLVAYLVCAPGARPGAPELRAALQQTLPRYMVPAAFVFLDALPLLPNGKLDRRALPAPLAERRDLNTAYVAPRGAFEVAIAELWSKLLRIEKVGIDDGFFELGGDSLLALEVLAGIKRSFSVEVRLSEFFSEATIAAIARLTEAKVLARLRQPTETPMEMLQHDSARRYEPFPLTDIQHALLIGRGRAVDLGDVGCHGYFEWDCVGLDLDRFQNAWRALIQRHDMLRAIISPDGSQRILAEVPDYDIRVIDLSRLESAATEEHLRALREELAHHVLPVHAWPLFDLRAAVLGGGRTRLFIGFDLLIMDAWSYFQIILPELTALYEEPNTILPKLDIAFRDYVVAAASAEEQSEDYQRSRRYWMERLAELPPAPNFPLRTAHQTTTAPKFETRGHLLERDAWSRLKLRGQQRGVTSSVVLVAAFAEILRAWTTSDRFTINFPIYDRRPIHPRVDRLVGDFTNTLLVAVEKYDGTFEERARSIQDQLWRDLEHHHFNGVKVMRELMRIHGGAANAAMPIVVTSLLGYSTRHDENTFGREIFAVSQTPQVLLDFQIRETDGALRFNWDSLDALFPPRMLDDMFAAFCSLLEKLAGHDPAWREPRFSLLPEWQREQRLGINATDAPVPEVLLHELLQLRAEERPNADAVIAMEKRLTFLELQSRVNQVGRKLRELGARPNQLVAVAAEKGWEQYVAVFGVLTSGAAYLPIDPNLPADRIRYLLEDGDVRIVLTQSALTDRLPWPESMQLLRIDRDFDAVDASPLPNVQRPTDLAYVIFTSGSTGKPKGVMVDHRGVVNMLMDINRRFGIGPEDRALALSALNFDASVYDVFGLLAAGGSVVIPKPFVHSDPEHWATLIAEERVTFWNSVPALMAILVAHVEGRGEKPLRSLRQVILSGDWIPLDLPDRLRALCTHVQLASSGGPTETIVWSVMYPVGEIDPEWRSIPYGKPITNQRYHILDARLEDRPTWVPGEMFVSSRVGLAHGYWHDDELNRRRFLTHPRTGEPLYATGDIGRYLPDGNIEILGRDDFQVKIFGHRIELGEIESALEEHPVVASAVVVATKSDAEPDGIALTRLAAFVVPRSAGAVVAEELFRHLRGRVPHYMVPSTIESLERLPLSRNGKVDRKELIQRSSRNHVGATEGSVAPRTPLEIVVASLCAEAFAVDRIGVHDNFFACGGDSLNMVQIAARIREFFEVEVSLRVFFTEPTVAQICNTITSHPDQAERVHATARALADLSIDDVDGLLTEN